MTGAQIGRRMTRIVLVFLSAAGWAAGASGQILVTGGDTLSLRRDSVVRLTVGEFRGSICWQRSDDGKQWITLDPAPGGQLTFPVNREAYVRAMVTEGTCNPVFSEQAVLLFTPPEVATDSVAVITRDSADCRATVVSSGGAAVTQRGFCWNTSGNPTIEDNIVTEGGGTGSYSGYLTGLPPDTTCCVRAYALNSKGIAYGRTLCFVTGQGEENSVTDADGNIYSIVKIGSQTWMKENLRVTCAPDKRPVTSFLFNDDPLNEQVHGRLYTWEAAMNGSTAEKAQGICPDGWHLPSDEEYKILEMSLGMTREEADLTNVWRGATVGTQLKTGGRSGFDAPLSGLRASSGGYYYMGLAAYLWSSSSYGSSYAWRRCLQLSYHTVGRYNTFPKNYGFSVRCVKND